MKPPVRNRAVKQDSFKHIYIADGGGGRVRLKWDEMYFGEIISRNVEEEEMSKMR